MTPRIETLLGEATRNISVDDVISAARIHLSPFSRESFEEADPIGQTIDIQTLSSLRTFYDLFMDQLECARAFGTLSAMFVGLPENAEASRLIEETIVDRNKVSYAATISLNRSEEVRITSQNLNIPGLYLQSTQPIGRPKFLYITYDPCHALTRAMTRDAGESVGSTEVFRS